MVGKTPCGGPSLEVPELHLQFYFGPMSKALVTIPDETLARRIFLIRGEKVMLDRDLAALYGGETKYLKRQVKRNMERFPEDLYLMLNYAP